MTNARENQPPGDRFEMSLSSADDRLRLSKWLPPRAGIVPHIRIGKRWINILWVVPIAFVVLILGIAVAQELRTIPAVQDFLTRYPGVPASAPAVHSGFPPWLRLQHFLNLFFMIFIIRSGIQILA
ncbi:MAG: oxidoreductase, partial [Actinomycetota bacterium]